MKDIIVGFIYRKLFKPAPLRRIINAILLAILPRSVELPEGRLYLNPHDPVVSGALAFGVYEQFELAVFRSVLQNGMTVLDIGANIGLYTVVAAQHVGPSGFVIACEPDPTNFSFLVHNINANNLSNTHLHQCALSDRPGSATLYLSNNNKGHHTLVPNQSDDFMHSIEVTAQRGDALIADAGHRVDVVKLDIEGAEPLALRGLKETLAQPNLMLFFEFSPGPLTQAGFNPKEELLHLIAQNFILYHLDGRRKKLRQIQDPEAFASAFRGVDYCNIVAIKGTRFAHLVESCL